LPGAIDATAKAREQSDAADAEAARLAAEAEGLSASQAAERAAMRAAEEKERTRILAAPKKRAAVDKSDSYGKCSSSLCVFSYLKRSCCT